MPQTKSTKINRTCLTCGNAFAVAQKRVNRGGGLYCSLSCSNKATARRRYVGHRQHFLCKQCGKQVNVKVSRPNPTYCSNQCRGDALKRESWEPTEEDIARFWSYVDTSPGKEECWNWTGAARTHGYGVVQWRGRPTTATRVSWEIAFGLPIPPMVLHRCDNPPCVNPSHLFGGNTLDNMKDCAEKGRTARGIRNGQAKLTQAQVIAIRAERCVPGSTEFGYSAIGRKYNISGAAVRLIVKGINWRHDRS